MKKCPYCAEEIQDDAIKCRYCYSDLRVDAETAMRQRPEQTAAAQAMTPAPAAGPGEPSAQYTHSGFRYVLGYGAESFGIWDRESPNSPAETFPRTDEGWRTAWIRFVGLEPNHVPVGATGAPPMTSPATSALSVPEVGDDQVLQYTHSGSTYLLGYGRTFFGIWQRSDPAKPIERFSRDDAGWAAAWRRFSSMESNYTDVGLGDPSAS